MTIEREDNNLWTDIKTACNLLQRAIDGDYAFTEHVPFNYNYFSLRINGKMRVIYCPTDELREIQRVILKRIIGLAAPHQSASAYFRGASIFRNAKIHQECKFLLKTDIVNFFHSISYADVLYTLGNSIPKLEQEKLRTLSEICTFRGFLPQGAPTSPHISNLFMRRFDFVVSHKAGEIGASYSRYADDIAISGQREEVVLALGYIVSQELERLGLRENL